MENSSESSYGLRSKIAESGDEFKLNLHAYEGRRLDKIRDTHISYARSAFTHIMEGMTVEDAVRIMIVEIPYNDMEVALIVEFLNYFFSQSNRSLRFDAALNVTEDGIITKSPEGTVELFVEDEANKHEYNEAVHKNLAEQIGLRVINNPSISIILQFAKADIIWDCMNTSLVAMYLNKYLESNSSNLRFDEFLDIKS